ncbi:hypothetical protein [Williamsia deligens]|uniref:Uncharacterized protein n=1 Tax=Williamsia deligens TaxID=321325 RepID=A0ABW3GBT4_9NOCA|nr:hypothetical protein [Williamsia deligens]MCP2192766.1 hypothetical protein [Williamsia deligens]
MAYGERPSRTTATVGATHVPVASPPAPPPTTPAPSRMSRLGAFLALRRSDVDVFPSDDEMTAALVTPLGRAC